MTDEKQKVEHWADTAQPLIYNGEKIDIRPVLKKQTTYGALLPPFAGENINHGFGSILFKHLSQKEIDDAKNVGSNE